MSYRPAKLHTQPVRNWFLKSLKIWAQYNVLGSLNNNRETANSRDESKSNNASNSKDASYNRSIGKSRELLQWLGSQQQHAGVQEASKTTVTVCLEVLTTVVKSNISETSNILAWTLILSFYGTDTIAIYLSLSALIS